MNRFTNIIIWDKLNNNKIINLVILIILYFCSKILLKNNIDVFDLIVNF